MTRGSGKILLIMMMMMTLIMMTIAMKYDDDDFDVNGVCDLIYDNCQVRKPFKNRGGGGEGRPS